VGEGFSTLIFPFSIFTIIMTLNKKLSAIVAVFVIGFLSIYAALPTFNSSNSTQLPLNITLNMQSGAQIPVSIPPGQALPIQLNGDQVVGLTYGGQYDPAGMNAVMQVPSGGSITMMWQMAGGQPAGVIGIPDVETVS
jgi:hypothetical protein